jgi:hypothetical protein
MSRSLSLPWELNDVPHGEIHHHFYKSTVAEDERDYYVYAAAWLYGFGQAKISRPVSSPAAVIPQPAYVRRHLRTILGD